MDTSSESMLSNNNYNVLLGTDVENLDRNLKLLSLERLMWMAGLKFFNNLGAPILDLNIILNLLLDTASSSLSEERPFYIATYCILNKLIFPYKLDDVTFHEPCLKTHFVKLLQTNRQAHKYTNNFYEIVSFELFVLMYKVTLEYLAIDVQHIRSATMSSLFGGGASSYCKPTRTEM